MIVAFAGRRAEALPRDTRPVAGADRAPARGLRPRVLVGAAADDADLILAEAGSPCRTARPCTSSCPLDRRRFVQTRSRRTGGTGYRGDRRCAQPRGTVTGLGLPPEDEAYRRCNQAILDTAAACQGNGERLALVVVASPGEGRMVEDLIGRAKRRRLPVLRVDPAVTAGPLRADAEGLLKTMPEADRAAQSRKASVRAKVEHPFLIVKRDFGFTKIRYRGIAKNLNHLHMLFASANWLMRARAVALTG